MEVIGFLVLELRSETLALNTGSLFRILSRSFGEKSKAARQNQSLGSRLAKRNTDAECNFSRKRSVFTVNF